MEDPVEDPVEEWAEVGLELQVAWLLLVDFSGPVVK